MIRSKTIFSALLCSVSFISLSAQAAPSAVTDWHVAPVLSVGQNAAPYCALATNYPEAGIIVTHARNKHGTGTIAFDFQDGEFDAGQYYGIDVSFDNMTRTFAAEARNNHLLVVEMAEDHPLYAALNAGQDLTIAVQSGGPSVTLAGNSRPFFQLNYCVQALNDDAAAEVIVQRPNNMPSFGLQQPASAPLLIPPAVRPKPLPVAPVAKAAPIVQPQIAQATVQDGDASRAELENMLDKARNNDTKPVRQKLSGISSDDEIDPGTIAPVNRNARQSLLFDDPTAANAYVPPTLSDMESSVSTTTNTKTSVKAEKPAPIAAKKITDTSKPVIPAPVPVKKEIAKTITAPVIAKAPAALPPTALPETLALPHDPAPLADSLPPPTPLAVPAPAKSVSEKAEIKNVQTRTLLASDYAKEQETGVAAKPYPPAPAKAVAEKITAPALPVVKHADITWDNPAPAPAPGIAKATESRPAVVTKTAAVKTMPTATADKKFADDVVVTTPKETDVKTGIFTGKPAEIKKTVTADIKADVSEKTVTSTVAAKAATETVKEAVAVPAAAVVAPKEAVKPVAAPKPAKVEKKLDAEATIARAEAPALSAPVMPAPAMPPAFVEDEAINNNVRGPMKRAEEVIAVSFPEDATDDGEALNAPLPQATLVPAQSAPVSVPTALLQNAMATTTIKFTPPPSETSLPWDVSAAGAAGEGGFCVMKNRFQNQQNLFLSRGTDGSATLGIDYGMDLLQVNSDYKTTVQLDNLFTEDFTGQARQANLLVVQMGRKDSFFDALRHAKALHVKLDGGASTFDVQGIAEKVPAFNICMVSQGGTKLAEATPVAAVAPAPVAPPVPTLMAAIAPAPVAPGKPAVTNNALPAPKTTAEIKAATTGNAMVTTPAAPVLAAPVAAMSASSLTLTPGQINTVLKQSHIEGTVRSDGKSYQWGSMSDTIRGELHEQRFADGKADLLEAVMRDIDTAEKACGGAFTSEMGIPEQYGNMEALPAESSCSTNGDVIVQASLYQRVGQMFRVWIQKSSQANRDVLVRQRDRLANVLQDNNLQ